MTQNKSKLPKSETANLGQLVARMGYALSNLNSVDRYSLTRELEIKCNNIANGYMNPTNTK